jgi:hypothetical protein
LTYDLPTDSTRKRTRLRRLGHERLTHDPLSAARASSNEFAESPRSRFLSLTTGRRLLIGSDVSRAAMSVASPEPEGPPSLLGVTIRRSVTSGRFYLAIGIGYSAVLAVATSFSSPGAFESGLALFLPVFAVMGSMGGLVVFTNDRVKGVFESLLAYGVSARRLFENVLAASLALATIVLVTALVVGLGIYVGTGHALTPYLVELLGIYSIPMSFSSAAFAAMVGMYWTSLSSPRLGMSNPTGLMPLIGIAPALIALGGATVVSITYGPSSVLVVIGAAVAAVAAIVLGLLSMAGRRMPLERLLSPA